ncbi:MAG: carboxylesterase family protein, partial [Anaerolineae bacterium]|nr:carboxylesterase family protein [Anaerolineae bacterium]
IPISAGISMAEDNTQTMVSSMADSRETAEALLYALLVNDGTAADTAAAADYVATQTDAQIAAYLRAQDATTLLAAWPTTKQASGVIPEGTVLPPHPLGAIRSGNYNHVPILAGYTANESKLLLGLSGVENGFILFDHAELFSMFAAYNPDSPTLTEADVIHESHLPPNTLFTGWNSVAALANISFTDPVRDRTMNAMREQQANLWAYQFSWAQEPTPWNTVFGAAHGFDLPFVFGNFGPSLFANIAFSAANAPGRLALSEKMIHTIAVFIRTGDPNNPELSVTWSAWPAQLIFDATPTTVDIRLKE